jgi:hypothetical protein
LSGNDPLERLPAWSTQDPARDVPAVSGPAYVIGAVHESIPEVASDPANVTATEWLYHPPSSALRLADGDTDGADASYLSPHDPAALTFPALSRHVPETEAVPESGPPYEADVHEAMPEVPSEPLNEIPTGWLNHPFASAERLGVPPVTVGASLSILNCR